jgi:formylglycine-generating enzyme required for sulfatase activity
MSEITTNDDAAMILIPEGPFIFGVTDEQLASLGYDAAAVGKWRRQYGERPASQVHLPGYYIDKSQVTNLQFRKFVTATKREKTRFLDSRLWGDPDQQRTSYELTD